MWFKRNTEYIVQWRYDQLKMWFDGSPSRDCYGYCFRRKKKALKYVFKMLARNSNCCPWRIVERNISTGQLHIIFESSIDKVEISEYYLKNFTKEESIKYHQEPIVMGKTKMKCRNLNTSELTTLGE